MRWKMVSRGAGRGVVATRTYDFNASLTLWHTFFLLPCFPHGHNFTLHPIFPPVVLMMGGFEIVHCVAEPQGLPLCLWVHSALKTSRWAALVRDGNTSPCSYRNHLWGSRCSHSAHLKCCRSLYIYTVCVCGGVEYNFPLFPNRHPLTSKKPLIFFFLVFPHHGRQLILVPVSPISSQNDQLQSIDPRNQRLYFTLVLPCFFFTRQQTLTGQGREKKKVLWHSWKDKSAERKLDRRRERRWSEGRETQR